jgi:hypothetical protein
MAAFDLDTGTVDPGWAPVADNLVRWFTLAPDGHAMFVAGRFASVDGRARRSIAEVSLEDGAVLPWAPQGLSADDATFQMAADGNRLVAALGGPAANNSLVSFDVRTGALQWADQTNGNVQCVRIVEHKLIVGGHFTVFAGEPRIRAARVSLDGTLGPVWHPSFEGSFWGPWSIQSDGLHVWVGGQFLTVSGVHQRSIARFTAT